MKRPAIRRNIREVANAKRNRRRDELIGIVKHGLDITGTALTELRDDQHWKDTHNSFADFCRDTFTISKTKLYVIIRTMEVGAKLPKRLQQKITNESQALALLKIPEDKWEEAIENAEKNGGITADNLLLHAAKPAQKTTVSATPQECGIPHSTKPTSAESKTQPKQKSEPPKTPPIKQPTVVDDAGTPIPLDAMPYAVRKKEVSRVTKQISDLRVEIKKARDDGDCLWVKHGQEAYEYLSRAYSYISDASPDCVCLTCQGTYSINKGGCNTCGNTGMISQYRFDHFLPKEMREIRLLSNADYAKSHEVTKVRPDPENVC